ncbi:hypothetical protein SNEBB_010461 [Seison nebaliae]|nr:hypothetical protein SNEBB_010461 [Seison nebaliae]
MLDVFDEESEDEQSIKQNRIEKRRFSILLEPVPQQRKTIHGCSINETILDETLEEKLEETLSPRDRDRKKLRNGFNDFCISSLDYYEYGKREMELAITELPALQKMYDMANYEQPLEGARISICSHINAQSAVMVETLIKLGAKVRWCACNIYSTLDEICSLMVQKYNIPIYAWRNENENDYWWCIKRCLGGYDDGDLEENKANDIRWEPNLLLDDGGDMTEILHTKFQYLLPGIKGVVEESSTGVHRLYHLMRHKSLLVPSMNIADALCKRKFDHHYSCRESVIDALKRTTDIMFAGKTVLVCGFGQVGEGCATTLRNIGCNVLITEMNALNALHACMDGYRVVLIEDVVDKIDIFITCTGGKSIIRSEHMVQMKNAAILCNIGHSNTEIDTESLEGTGCEREHVRQEVDHIIFPSKKYIVLVAQGRPINITCSGIPSLVLSISYITQILAAIEMHKAPTQRYSKDVYLLPKKMNDYVALLHLKQFDAKLTKPSDAQKECISHRLENEK